MATNDQFLHNYKKSEFISQYWKDLFFYYNIVLWYMASISREKAKKRKNLKPKESEKCLYFQKYMDIPQKRSHIL